MIINFHSSLCLSASFFQNLLTQEIKKAKCLERHLAYQQNGYFIFIKMVSHSSELLTYCTKTLAVSFCPDFVINRTT